MIGKVRKTSVNLTAQPFLSEREMPVERLVVAGLRVCFSER
jgi:hypothetical protein